MFAHPHTGEPLYKSDVQLHGSWTMILKSTRGDIDRAVAILQRLAE